MPDPTTHARGPASTIVVALAVAALTTAGAGTGVATLLTGSPSPSVWLQAYEHSRECHQAGAANDPRCSAAAAEAIVKLRIAAELESKAKSLIAARPSPPPVLPVARPKPATQPVAPAFRAPLPPSDDGVDG
ncbi:MAG TPA: hypothetical protein VGJ79_14225 [Candidatus Dormibacteraeota bacterium]|jgi:hypothetical protein